MPRLSNRNIRPVVRSLARDSESAMIRMLLMYVCNHHESMDLTSAIIGLVVLVTQQLEWQACELIGFPQQLEPHQPPLTGGKRDHETD